MTSALGFSEACHALDEALHSPQLTDAARVEALVLQESLGADGSATGGAGPPWLPGAVARTFEVLEVLRSASGEDHQAVEGEGASAREAPHDPHPHPLPPPSLQGDAKKQREEEAVHQEQAGGQGQGQEQSAALSPVHGLSVGRRGSLLKAGTLRLARLLSIGSNDEHSHLHTAWHLQEQGKEHRVMYRPGPPGTPFHTMLLEGILHCPVGTALAVCWETPYYTHWWPQFTVPPFKVTESKVHAEISRTHNLAGARLKVPWPFAPRELAVSSRLALVDPASGLLVVTLDTIPEDPHKCSEASTGYAPDKAPKVPYGMVRLGVQGGYALKSLGPSSCYFRAFSNVDLRLDVAPPWIINFITRTLAGAGFQLLSQVASDAVAGKVGIGMTFQKLLADDSSLYREVDRQLSQPPLPGLHTLSNPLREVQGEAEAPGHQPLQSLAPAGQQRSSGAALGPRGPGIDVHGTAMAAPSDMASQAHLPSATAPHLPEHPPEARDNVPLASVAERGKRAEAAPPAVVQGPLPLPSTSAGAKALAPELLRQGLQQSRSGGSPGETLRAAASADVDMERAAWTPVSMSTPLMVGNANLASSLAARDPELSDALGILEDAIQLLQSDAFSTYSEAPRAALNAPHAGAGQRSHPSGELGGEVCEDCSVSQGLERKPVESADHKKRWWTKLRFRRLKPLPE